MKHDYTIRREALEGVEAFLRVAERRSFRAAADDLGVSPSAISQTIKALEARVGAALFTRTTRSVGLTEAGQQFLERARPAFDELVAAYDSARTLGDRPAGLLRLNTPRAVIPMLLTPVLASFYEAFPDVKVEIYAEDAFADLAAGGFDAGIRLGESLQADMVAVRLTPPFRFVVAATPEYLNRHGRPLRLEELRNHACIRTRFARGAIAPWHFARGNRHVDVTVDGPLILNDLNAMLDAALQGVGLAHMAEPHILPHIANGELETVLDDYASVSPGVFLYYPGRAQMLPKLRAFIDHVRDHPALMAQLGRMMDLTRAKS